MFLRRSFLDSLNLIFQEFPLPCTWKVLLSGAFLFPWLWCIPRVRMKGKVQWLNTEHKHSNIKDERGARKEFITRRLLNNVDSFMCIQLWCLFLGHFGLELKDKSMYMSPGCQYGASVLSCHSENWGGNESQTTQGSWVSLYMINQVREASSFEALK